MGVIEVSLASAVPAQVGRVSKGIVATSLFGKKGWRGWSLKILK